VETLAGHLSAGQPIEANPDLIKKQGEEKFPKKPDKNRLELRYKDQKKSKIFKKVLEFEFSCVG